MLVHSFSPTNEWLEDFDKFTGLYDIGAELNKISSAGHVNGIDLYLAWVKGKDF